jgi:hypothetical protein
MQEPMPPPEDDAEETIEASPEEQAQYEFLSHAGLAIIGAPGQIKKALQVITSADTIPQGVGYLVGSIMFELADDAEQESGIPYDDDAGQQAMVDMIEQLRDDLETAGFCNANDDEQKVDNWFAEALHTAIVVSDDGMLQNGKKDRRLLAKRMAEMIAGAPELDDAMKQQIFSAAQQQGAAQDETAPADDQGILGSMIKGAKQ